MYKIQIQNKLLKNNQITAMHIMVAIIFILLGAITSSLPKNVSISIDIYIPIYGYILLFSGIVITGITIFKNKKIIQGKANKFLRYYELIILLSVLIYTLMKKLYLPFTYAATTLLGVIFAIVWEQYGKKEHFVIIDEKGVSIPKFMRVKIIPWRNIKRFLLKHGLITIDCRNNTLFQYKKLEKVDKEKIQKYVEEKIAENAEKYDADWDS